MRKLSLLTAIGVGLVMGQANAAPPPSQNGYQINLGIGYSSPSFVYGQVPMWIDTSNTSVAPYGLPRPASTEFPLPVSASPAANSPGSGPITPGYSSPGAVTALQTGSTTSATPGTFSIILSAATSNTRTFCWIVNTSTDYLYIFFASATQPTPTLSNSDPIAPGQSYPCNLGGVVAQNAVWLSAKTMVSASYTLKYFQ